MKLRTLFSSFSWVFLIIAIIGLFFALTWINLEFSNLIPLENEFTNKWQITRDFIFNQTNPYNQQNGYTFRSPFPALFIYFPFALLGEITIAQAVWTTFIQIASFVFTFLCIRNTSWQINRLQIGAIILFAIFWYPSISVFLRGSTVSILGIFLMAAMLAFQNNQDELAGVFLTFSALELRITLFSVLLLLIWMGSQRKWLSFFWAGATFLLLSGFGLILHPSWPIDFFWSTLRFTAFNFGQAVIETTTRWWPGIGIQVGWGFVIAVAVVLLAEWWIVFGKNAKMLTWTLAFTGIISIWIGFETNIDHVYVTLFPIIIIFAAWNRRWGRSGSIFSFVIMGILLLGLWWAFIYFQSQNMHEASNPILIIGFPVLVLIGHYWVRWWYLRPDYLILNEN